MPLIHGTVTFREERKNYICMDIDIQGVPATYLYGIQVGRILFPPIAADMQGCISMTFCRKGDFDNLFSDSSVTLFRYDERVPDVQSRHQNVASGKVRRVILGGKDYREFK